MANKCRKNIWEQEDKEFYTLKTLKLLFT